MPRKSDRRSVQIPTNSNNCVFCNSAEDDELKYGKIYHHNGITTHYYCLLLSSNMQQKGDDHEGILGFLYLDIMDELKRGKRLSCSFCKRTGATLGCCNTKCKKIFHLPCGMKSGSLHQFFGEFRSYCSSHRPRQKIDDKIRSQIAEQLCYICYDNVDRDNLLETLWAPCCKKNAWFHRLCVQQLAMSAGYFFKCPLCNNKNQFQKAMLDNGIYIPSQDASWELVPNAFQELLYRHNRCDAGRCICSKGRQYTSTNPKWELILCRTCGSQGIHVACGRLQWKKATWDCRECTAILTKGNPNDNVESENVGADTRESFDNFASDGSDSEISVGVEEPVHETTSWPEIEPPRATRPGPKSFKLKQQKILELSDRSGSSSSQNSREINLNNSRIDELRNSSLGSVIVNLLKNSGDQIRGIQLGNARHFLSSTSGPSSASLAFSDAGRGPELAQLRHSVGHVSAGSIQMKLGGYARAHEELVVIDSDEEIIPEKVAAAKDNESIPGMHGQMIAAHQNPTSIPNGVRFGDDGRSMKSALPMVETSAVASEGHSHSTGPPNSIPGGRVPMNSTNGSPTFGHVRMPHPLTLMHGHYPSGPAQSSVGNYGNRPPGVFPGPPLQLPPQPPPPDLPLSIKISNVTSLPPEAFDSPQSASNVNGHDGPPEVVDVESDNDNPNTNCRKSMEEQLTRIIVNELGAAQPSALREKRPASLTPERPARRIDNVGPQDTTDPKRPRTDTGSEATTPDDGVYKSGVDLENAAIVNVLGKNFVLPLPEETHVKVSNTWTPSDGDAGTSPARETNLPIAGCPSDRAGTMGGQSGDEGYTCTTDSASADPNSQSPPAPTSTNAGVAAPSDNTNRLNVEQVSLKDLKFRMSANNTLRMSVNDLFTLDLNLDTGQPRQSRPRSGRRSRNGSSLVRRSSTAHDPKIKTEINPIKSPTRDSTPNNRLPKSPERRTVTSIKENLAPLLKIPSVPSSPERKPIKRLRLDSGESGHYNTRQRLTKTKIQDPSTSRDGLKELSDSLINQRSDSSSGPKMEKSEINCQVSCTSDKLPISIDLSRIEPLLIIEANKKTLTRGLLKFRSLTDLRDNSIDSDWAVRQCKSFDCLALASDTHVFDINDNDDKINPQRRGQKRKTRSFEKHDCMR